jgi:hypothetical protein
MWLTPVLLLESGQPFKGTEFTFKSKGFMKNSAISAHPEAKTDIPSAC